MSGKPKPNTCCGACHYNSRGYRNRWYYAESTDGYAIPANFCPECGARLLPSGEVEPNRAAELEAKLAVRERALLNNSMHIAFLVADGKPDEYYVQVALDQAREELAKEEVADEQAD